jgi:hypothetical protein
MSMTGNENLNTPEAPLPVDGENAGTSNEPDEESEMTKLPFSQTTTEPTIKNK